jgi:pSer/pThr/pTyr-binding forkhead associated (FHA) protein
MHESISREHACIVLDTNKGCLLIDLDSTAGTKVDGTQLEANRATELKPDAKVEFGGSTRSYIVKLDFTPYQKFLKEHRSHL